MKEELLEVIFPSLLTYVPIVRKLVSYVAVVRGNFSKKDAYRIETIVDEICNNAVQYGSLTAGSEVVLKCILTDEGIDIIVTDKGGKSYDIAKLKENYLRALEMKERLYSTRGKGLRIVRMLSDEIDVNVNQDGETEVHIVKYKMKSDI